MDEIAANTAVMAKASLLFFGFIWLAAVQLVSGLLLVALAAAIWRVFAGEWEAWPFDEGA